MRSVSRIRLASDDISRLAFHRGQTPLGQPPAEPNAPPQAEQPAPTAPGESKADLLQNVRTQNSIFNGTQRQNYQNLLQNEDQGVKAKAAY